MSAADDTLPGGRRRRAGAATIRFSRERLRPILERWIAGETESDRAAALEDLIDELSAEGTRRRADLLVELENERAKRADAETALDLSEASRKVLREENARLRNERGDR